MDERLAREIEKAAGRTVKTPRDFDWLSGKIFERTHERISPTTLKRLFGYLAEQVAPRSYTLDVLARFTGYRDYAAFNSNDGGGEPQSNIITGEKLTSEGLDAGRTLRLTWPPGRLCTVRHEGKGRFRVIQAENTKLCVGDTFTCHLFIQHEPLFIDNLLHCGGKPTGYVAGRRDGVTFEVL